MTALKFWNELFIEKDWLKRIPIENYACTVYKPFVINLCTIIICCDWHFDFEKNIISFTFKFQLDRSLRHF